ncbi:hypothetical protein [Flavilitoribacter nigricans]|uniref:Uncharacterized protein n=1 Tax=Flavilitoribacter nigricans (strain ATCC 23147 / DSM 23189 / NBRC 102662 / NCIMB 1420 / SS-2) TaxID=1122177 RepID=A0A2D0MYB7_FLAN2|nr:hypothetical protein [Flavilitoribacter nigricans]PHN01282.1 hypothetical protein CRP01_38030 [Flavilitoribacter nigricans DSM 23189 = NBRC 102662]
MKKWDTIWLVAFIVLGFVSIRSVLQHRNVQKAFIHNADQLEETRNVLAEMQKYYEGLAINRTRLEGIKVDDILLYDSSMISVDRIRDGKLYFYYREQNCDDCVMNAQNHINSLPEDYLKLVNVIYETDNPRKYLISTSGFESPKYYTNAGGRFGLAANEAFFFQVDRNGDISEAFYPSRFNPELLGRYLRVLFSEKQIANAGPNAVSL